VRTASRLSKGGLKDASGTAAKDTISIGSGDHEVEQTAWGWRFIVERGTLIAPGMCPERNSSASRTSSKIVSGVLRHSSTASFMFVLFRKNIASSPDQAGISQFFFSNADIFPR